MAEQKDLAYSLAIYVRKELIKEAIQYQQTHYTISAPAKHTEAYWKKKYPSGASDNVKFRSGTDPSFWQTWNDMNQYIKKSYYQNEVYTRHVSIFLSPGYSIPIEREYHYKKMYNIHEKPD
jgi:hypothetical protein